MVEASVLWSGGSLVSLPCAAPNKALELTASSFGFACASGGGSPPALGVMKRGFTLLHENWSGAGLRSTLRAPSALQVEEPWCHEPVR